MFSSETSCQATRFYVVETYGLEFWHGPCIVCYVGKSMNYGAALCLTVVLSVGARPAVASSILLNESFTGTTAPGWKMTGPAKLTAGTVDTPGNGWLRLTGNGANQAGFAYMDDALPFNYGLDIDFRYSVWGGTGADGFALVMFDGSVTPDSAGAYGGSLGYAQRSGVGGLRGAILGIGFDEFGNFANPTEGRQGGTGFSPDTITVRGPGDGTANALTSWGVANYGLIATIGNLVGSVIQAASWAVVRPTSDAAYREAQVIVDTTQLAEYKLQITGLVKQGATGQKVVVENYDAYNEVVAYYRGVENIPATMKFGFTGSTGGSTNYHELQAMRVMSLEDAPGFEPVAPEGSTWSMVVAGALLVGVSKRRRKRTAA